jgi:hypothetical protein
MHFEKLVPPLASAILAAIAVTALLTLALVVQIQDAWNIAVVSEVLLYTKASFIWIVSYTLLLGIPLFFLLRALRPIGLIACACGGFFLGAVPVLLSVLLFFGSNFEASTGGRLTVVNGVPTLAGWLEYAQGAGLAGLMGLAGGLTFWAAMRFSGEKLGGSSQDGMRSSRSRLGYWSSLSAAVLLSCTILFLPGVVRDNSCHNLFRDGRSSIEPKLTADIDLSSTDWPALERMFARFSTTHALSLRRDQQIRDGSLLWRDLNLCNEAGVNIGALDQRLLKEVHAPHVGQGVKFSVYELKAGSGWSNLTRSLLSEIEKSWPQRTKFFGPDGREISAADAFKEQR